MTTIKDLGLLLLAAATSTTMIALSAPAGATPPKASAPAEPVQCDARTRGADKETQDMLNAIRSMKKDNGGGVPPEAQAILDQMTAMYENDDSRSSADMADAMREFAGGRAPRRPRC